MLIFDTIQIGNKLLQFRKNRSLPKRRWRRQRDFPTEHTRILSAAP